MSVAVMPDHVTQRLPESDRSRSGVFVMDRWYCDGTNQKSGQRCGQLLMECRLTVGSAVRIKCHKCGTFHTLKVQESFKA
jgi:hypothetical protein